MILNFEPYEAIGPLRFGMTQDEVVAAMGSPQRITKNHLGTPELWYNDLNAIMENNRLVEVGFGPNAPLSICGIRPFVDQGAFVELCKLDGNPHEVLGSIVLKRLGISLGGFHDNDESQKGITAFERGRWDVLDSQMKPFAV